MTRVLADFHHADLFESYQLTLGDRFGWDVYRPIGMDWFDRWYWSFERAYHGDAVARQYLSLWDGDEDRGDEWTRVDRTHPGRTFRMVTLDQALAQPWDLVIASVPDNYRGFAKLAAETGARFVAQFGNQWQDVDVPDGTAAALVSTTGIATRVPQVVYHQEFSLRDFYPAVPVRPNPSVRSFVNCFPETPEYPRFRAFAESAPDFAWEVYGAYGSAPDDLYKRGNLDTTPAVAAAMRGAFVIWHAKYWSDGYGHVIHNAFASGRPVFGSARYYRDKLAGPLWTVGVDVDGLSPDGVAQRLSELYNDQDAYARMCEASARRFREVVDFDADAEAVRTLLEGVMR